MSENETLKPCGHCGGEAVTCDDAIGAYVACQNCGVRTARWSSADITYARGYAVAAWNRRAGDAPVLREYTTPVVTREPARYILNLSQAKEPPAWFCDDCAATWRMTPYRGTMRLCVACWETNSEKRDEALRSSAEPEPAPAPAPAASAEPTPAQHRLPGSPQTATEATIQAETDEWLDLARQKWATLGQNVQAQEVAALAERVAKLEETRPTANVTDWYNELARACNPGWDPFAPIEPTDAMRLQGFQVQINALAERLGLLEKKQRVDHEETHNLALGVQDIAHERMATLSRALDRLDSRILGFGGKTPGVGL